MLSALAGAQQGFCSICRKGPAVSVDPRPEQWRLVALELAELWGCGFAVKFLESQDQSSRLHALSSPAKHFIITSMSVAQYTLCDCQILLGDEFDKGCNSSGK